jgi:hypothetical protein
VVEAIDTARAGSAIFEYMICYSNFIQLQISEPDCRELILVTAWYIWWMRRNVVNGEKEQRITNAALSIRVLTANFTRSLKKGIQEKTSSWQKPPENFVSVNIDAALDLLTMIQGVELQV